MEHIPWSDGKAEILREMVKLDIAGLKEAYRPIARTSGKGKAGEFKGLTFLPKN